MEASSIVYYKLEVVIAGWNSCTAVALCSTKKKLFLKPDFPLGAGISFLIYLSARHLAIAEKLRKRFESIVLESRIAWKT